MLIYWINSVDFQQLQEFWWLICSVLGALFLSCTFVYGALSSITAVVQSDHEKMLISKTLGRQIELVFAVFILFGFFLTAAFSLFFAISFDGAFLLWLLIIFSHVFQAILFEFYKTKSDLRGGSYGSLLVINGSAGIFLIGVAIATFFSGSGFVINNNGQTTWSGSLGGLEAVFSLFNICFGLFLVFSAKALGTMFLVANADRESSGLAERLRTFAVKKSKYGLPFFAYMFFRLFSMGGFTTNSEKEIVSRAWNYLITLNDIPGIFLALLIGLGLWTTGLVMTSRTESRRGFWFAGPGAFLFCFSLFALAGFNNNSFYPSNVDPQSSLTIYNASSGEPALRHLTYIFFFLTPFIIGAFFWLWWPKDREKRVAKIKSLFDLAKKSSGITFNLPQIITLLSIGAAIIIILFPPETLSPPEVKTAALTIVAVALWATAIFPAYLTAFALFIFCMLFSVVPASVIFSGFSSAALWLIFSGLILGIALKSTGLGERIAGKIAINLINKEYQYIIGGVVAFGVLLGFIMPSAMGRIVLFIPIALALAERFGFKEGSNGRTGIVLAATFGSTMPASAILPSNVPNMVMAGTAETIYNISPLYGEYLLLHFPFLGFAKAVLIALVVARLYPDTPSIKTKEEIKITPWTGGEIQLSVILVVLLALWLTDFIHHISPAWVALAAAFLLLLPKRGLVTAKQFNDKVNYGSLFFVAGVLGLGAMVAYSGLGSKLAHALMSVLPLKEGHPLLNYISLTITATVTGIATTVPGAPAVLTPLASDMAHGAGVEIKTILMSQVLGFSTVIFPYQAPPLVVGMQLAGEKMAPALKFCLILAGLTFIILLPVNFIWWKILGWL